jgi:glycosyltransferase A (GT-A) superfamily protein (DUF2064 family)
VTALLVIAKAPVAGRVRTRLCPPCSPAEAAELAAAARADTLAAVSAAAGAARRVLVLEGTGGDWVPPGFDIVRQRGDGLAERLAAAFADAGGPSLLVGMDTPQQAVVIEPGVRRSRNGPGALILERGALEPRCGLFRAS